MVVFPSSTASVFCQNLKFLTELVDHNCPSVLSVVGSAGLALLCCLSASPFVVDSMIPAASTSNWYPLLHWVAGSYFIRW